LGDCFYDSELVSVKPPNPYCVLKFLGFCL
jgi:hypothetical protein